MKQNKKSGFALIAGIGIIALIAIVGFLVIKSNVIDPAKNAAAVVKANITATGADTYGPNCPNCADQEAEVRFYVRRYQCARDEYEKFADQVVRGRGSQKPSKPRLDCQGIGMSEWFLPIEKEPAPATNQSIANAAMKVRDDLKKKLDEAQKALDECIERKKIYCEGYEDGLKIKEEAAKAKEAEERNADRKRELNKLNPLKS